MLKDRLSSLPLDPWFWFWVFVFVPFLGFLFLFFLVQITEASYRPNPMFELCKGEKFPGTNEQSKFMKEEYSRIKTCIIAGGDRIRLSEMNIINPNEYCADIENLGKKRLFDAPNKPNKPDEAWRTKIKTRISSLFFRDARDELRTLYHCLETWHGQEFKSGFVNKEDGEIEWKKSKLRRFIPNEFEARRKWNAILFLAIISKILLILFCCRLIYTTNITTFTYSARVKTLVFMLIFTLLIWWAFLYAGLSYDPRSHEFLDTLLRMIPGPNATVLSIFVIDESANDMARWVIRTQQLLFFIVVVFYIGAAAFGAVRIGYATLRSTDNEIDTDRDKLALTVAKYTNRQSVLLYAGSIVLIIGLLETRSLYDWPLSLVDENSAAFGEIRAATNGLIFTWGTYASAILLLTYLPISVWISRTIGTLIPSSENTWEKRKKWLKCRGLGFDLRGSVGRVLVILGPVIAGSIESGLLQSLT